jgi:hypothetical protein
MHDQLLTAWLKIKVATLQVRKYGMPDEPKRQTA